MSKILILNGPNLNMLGTRQPEIYGHTKLQDIEAACQGLASELHLVAECAHSNHEGELVSLIKADDKVHDHEFFLLGHVANSIGYSPEKVAEVIKNKGISGNKSSGWFSWLFG